MDIVTVDFLKRILGQEAIVGNGQEAWKGLETLLYMYKNMFPGIPLESNPLTPAILAREFVLNAELYFINVGSAKGKNFFNLQREEFTKHFNYARILDSIKQGDQMLFLYTCGSSAKRKLDAHGVIGRFHSIESGSNLSTPYLSASEKSSDDAITVIKLEISNNGIIPLPAYDMAYFGKWDRKLELIM